MDEEILIQHALKLLAELEYDRQDASTELLQQKLALAPKQLEHLLVSLRQAELVSANRLTLTANGREYALHILQAHRLYETYLAKKTGHPESVWHQLADEREHTLSKDDVSKLADELGHPRFDPHGDPIPTSGGDMPLKHGKSLADCPVGWAGRVVHIEDEPSQLYAHISETGITTGSVLRIEGKEFGEVRILTEGQTFRFPDEAACQITAIGLGTGETFDESIERLSALKLGEKAEILGMSSLCRGLERNRLLDLGVVPGTVTTVELMNPAGSPIGYRIRGACIALRKEQADRIRIRKVRQ